MSEVSPPGHTQRLVASVYGWRTYRSWCDCCTPGAQAVVADKAPFMSSRPRNKPDSPVLAWRTRLAIPAE